jgi:hypothetical protein
MYNKKVLIDSLKNLGSAKAPTKPKDKIFSEPLVSNEGYKQGPPPAGSHYRIPGNENGTSIYNPTPYALNLVGPNGTQAQIEPWDTNIQYFDEPYIDEYPQMKKGGALLTKKVTCKNCGWKWNAADGGDDVTTCHKCGSQGLVHAQDGGVTTQEEINNANAAMMKARLAYANMHGNPAAQRMIVAPDQPYQFEDGNTGTHYMASMDNYAVPQIQNVDGQLMLGDYSPESAEAMKFDNPEDAQYFAKNYKTVSPAFIETELTPEEIQEYAKGGYVVEDISIPELQDGGEGAELNLDLPEQTVYANESKRKLQGSLIDKLSQVKNAYQDYRENAGLTKLRLKNEGVSSIESLKRNIKEYKTQLEEEKKSFDRAQKALNVLQKKDPKTWENKKLKDVMSAQGVDALRSLYKDGKISNESFIDFYNNFGKQFDREAVKTSAEDQVKLEDSWYGKKDKQGRRTWMSNPMNVAKIAQGVAIGAPLAPVAAMAAPTIASGASSLIPAAQTALNASMLGVPGLTANNLLWGAGAYLSANEVMDPKSTTRTSINRAIKDPTLSNIGEATGNTAMTALGFAGIPVKAGVASLADDITQAGRHLTTQTLLKDTYKINPNARTTFANVDDVGRGVANTNELPPPPNQIFIDNDTSINLQRVGNKSKKNIYKKTETINENGFDIKTKYRGDKNIPAGITIEGKSGYWQLKPNKIAGDNTWYFSANMDNQLESGKAMLKMNEKFPFPKPSILEPNNLSLDSYNTLLNMGKRKDWSMQFENYIPLNYSAKHSTVLKELNLPNTPSTSVFKSEVEAQKALEKVNEFLVKKGINEKAKVYSAGDSFGIKIPNFRLTRNYAKGGAIELKLTPKEIEWYKSQGYIVEDISVPELNQFQTGGSRLLRSAVNQLSLFDDPVKVLKKNISPKLITNVSGFTIPQIQKTLLPQYKNLTDQTFKNTVFSPSGKLYEAPQFSLQDFYDPLPVGYTMPFGDYKNEFNSRLDMLNSLIEKNNTSGIPYESLGLTNDGLLKFKSPHGISAWDLKIQPGSFTNENLEDIIDPVYWRGIPGLEMSDTSQGVFGPGFNIEGNIPRGTSAYRSLNDYMKKFNLGRVKSGFNAQTPEGMSAWEKLIKNNEAIGYFERPDRIFGIMKKDGGELQLGDEVDEATMKKLEKLGYTFEKI